jgi:CBS domain containing-hemolysin-like protein
VSFLGSIAIAATGVVASALCSGLETGLYVVNRVRLAVCAGRGERRAVRLEQELERPDRLLATLLIANNAANYAGSLGVAALIETLVTPVWAIVVLNTLVVVPILFVFGETVPKDLFRTRADQWMPRFAATLTSARRLFTLIGLVTVFAGLSRLVRWLVGVKEEDARSPRARVTRFIRESHASGSLSEAQLDLADRAMAMRRRTVSGEMTPWRQVATVTSEERSIDGRALARRTLRSRLPVVEAGRVIGLVEVQDLLLNGGDITAAIQTEVPRFEPATPAYTALESLRRQRRPVGIVEDASGRPIGMVTLKDLVEPLLGDLRAW